MVAGASYGGFLSQEYALAYPEHVVAVMLRDTAADHRWEQQAEENALSSPRIKDTLDYAKYRRVMDGTCLSDEDMRDCYAEIQPLYNVNWDPIADAEKLDRIHFHHATHNYAFQHNLPGWDLKPRLPEVQVPVLITHGRHDWIIPAAAAEEMAGLFPDARLVIFENSGHSPQIEEVERWEEAIRQFLADHGRTATSLAATCDSERPQGAKNLDSTVRNRLQGTAEILRRSLRSLLRMISQVVVLAGQRHFDGSPKPDE